MIKTENLSKTFSSGTKAVDNLTINVEDGEIFGFLGPNGAGKNTAIKILTTLSRPTSGQAWVGGYNVQTEPVKVRCAIGYVAQETGVDYFLTGRENLVLQGRMYRMDGKTINRRVDELLELFSIRDCADQLVSTYSGGMRRKLDIATALIHNPRLIFLDEPTLGLDPHSRSQLWNYIRMLNRDLNVTIFLTTHYLDEADKLSNRIGILHKGSIKIIDTPDKLKDSIRGDSVNLELKGSAKDKAISILKGDTRVKEILLENEHVRVYVNNGSEAIQWMMKLLNQNNIDVSSLSISRPSLDDVYLKYSGASFKEGDAAEGGEPWWAKWQKAGWGKNWKGSEDSSQDSQEGDQQEWGNGNKEWEGSEDNGDKVSENGDKGWEKWSPEEMKAWWGQNKDVETETDDLGSCDVSCSKEVESASESDSEEWGKWSPEEMTAWWNQNKSKEKETPSDNGNAASHPELVSESQTTPQQEIPKLFRDDIVDVSSDETTAWIDKLTQGECKMEQEDKVEVVADKDKEVIKDNETKEEENNEEPWKKWQGTPEAAEWWAKQGKKEG